MHYRHHLPHHHQLLEFSSLVAVIVLLTRCCVWPLSCLVLLGGDCGAEARQQQHQQVVQQQQQQQQQLQQQHRIMAANVTGKDDWYKRYKEYPPYCSTPAEMSKRSIPPLSSSSSSGGQSETTTTTTTTRLVHVTTIIRHGARTPWNGNNMKCWENYTSLDKDTGVWDCNLTTILAPPSPERIDEEEEDDETPNQHYAGQDTEAMFLFEKKYDALMDPKHNLSNELKGTCEVGQLLLRGYEQEIVNGQHLRDAYVYTGDNDTTHDPRMKLIDISVNDGIHYPWGYKNLYYRADDDQRTLMSGQVLLRGMYEPEIKSYFQSKHVYPVIPLHTADRKPDILAPNEASCDRLKQIRQVYEKSTAFTKFNESDEATTLRNFQRNVLKIEPDMDAIDCLMTTICTDRILPDPVNDYTTIDNDSSSSSSTSKNNMMFQRLTNFDTENTVRLYENNNAEYAKHAMGPLWNEIMTTIHGIISGESHVCCPSRPPTRLSLFSGHDTTIMPLLSSLGLSALIKTNWTPYASMMLIEIHEIINNNSDDGQQADNNNNTTTKQQHAFRLLYNGKVITNLMTGCPKDAELCDAQILVDYVQPFATREYNCTRQQNSSYTTVTVSKAQDIIWSTPGGIVSLGLLVIGSCLFGSLATYLYMMRGGVTRRRRRQGKGNRVSQNDDDDDDYDEDGISMGTIRTTPSSSPTSNGGEVIRPSTDGTFT